MTRSRIGINTVANLIGSLGTTAATVALIPMYLRLLGMEALGLIGVNASLSVIAGFADFGLAPTLGREMARSWTDPDDVARGRTLLESLNRLYIPLAMVLGIAIALAAPLIVSYWLTSQQLPRDVVVN